MDRNKFIISVKLFSNPKDFFKNKNILDKVDPWNRTAFINCLKYGNDILQANETAKIIFRITAKTALSENEVFDMMPDFIMMVQALQISNKQ